MYVWGKFTLEQLYRVFITISDSFIFKKNIFLEKKMISRPSWYSSTATVNKMVVALMWTQMIDYILIIFLINNETVYNFLFSITSLIYTKNAYSMLTLTLHSVKHLQAIIKETV